MYEYRLVNVSQFVTKLLITVVAIHKYRRYRQWGNLCSTMDKGFLRLDNEKQFISIAKS
jgi:hypothetical protein